MLLELEDVRVSYGGVEALKGVSMKVGERSIICLIGANGAGKTTTLRSISGLEKPTSGQIRFKGERIDGVPPDGILARGIVQVPERGRLFPDMTAYENLVIGAYIRRDKLAINRDLEAVYEYFPILKGRAKQRAKSLSGGERGMLAIARALMSKPTLLLMDEPTLGLAPKIVSTLGEIIISLNSNEIAIFLAEQNARMALGVAHLGYVMEMGRVALEGDAKDLMNDERVRKAYLG